MRLFQRDRRRSSMAFTPRGDGLEDRFLLSQVAVGRIIANDSGVLNHSGGFANDSGGVLNHSFNADFHAGSSTSTTRITPPAGFQVARNVLYRLVTRSPYSVNASTVHPRLWPARLARLIRSVPY